MELHTSHHILNNIIIVGILFHRQIHYAPRRLSGKRLENAWRTPLHFHTKWGRLSEDFQRFQTGQSK